MKKIALLLLLCLAANIHAERIDTIPFGDMESWTVRYIKESKLLGGQTKTLYAVAPTDTIWENGPYIYGQNGNPWYPKQQQSSYSQRPCRSSGATQE